MIGACSFFVFFVLFYLAYFVHLGVQFDVYDPNFPAGLSATEFRQTIGAFVCHDLRREKL